MIDKLNEIIDYLNSSNLSLNAKIRYAYIELGKLVHKDAMFFYTIQNNLLGQGKENIQYSYDKLNKIVNEPNYFDYKVICKTVADMLNYIFEKCNIQSEIRKTTKKEIYITDEGNIEIRHYFVSVKGENGKYYALTLNPDLPNIHIGKQTSHFGNLIDYKKKIEYEDEEGNIQTKIEQVYEGDEIPFSVMTPEELRRLDIEIGYLSNNDYEEDLKYTDYYLNMLKTAYLKDKGYINDLVLETQFYYDLCKLLNGEYSLEEVLTNGLASEEEKENVYPEFNFKDKTHNDWVDIKKFIIFSVISKLYNDCQIDMNNNYLNLIEENRYDEIFNKFKNDFLNTGINKSELKKSGEFNPLLKIRQMIDFFKLIDDYENNKNINIKKFREGIMDLGKIFVDQRLLNHNNASSAYIAHKISTSFEKIFDLGHETDFSKLELAEQITIIKEILNLTFKNLKVEETPDILKKDDKKDETKEEKEAKKNKPAIQQRLLLTTLFDKQSHQPYYLMCVKRTINDNNTIPIIFDIKNNNLITNMSLVDISNNYYIVKDEELTLIIENIEKSSLEIGNQNKL